MSIKLFFGILSLIPAVLAYVLYFRDIFASKTKPHTFSWLIWGTLAADGFFAQISAHAGIGAWVTGLTAAASLAIFCVALYKGETKPSRFDWALLTMALIGLVLLLVIDNKAVSLTITLFALTAGFTMTIRKAYRRPQEETVMSFFLNAVKFVPGILALSSFSFLTVAYPVVACLGNAAIVLAIYLGKRHKPALRSTGAITLP